jgi:iron complex outermembrane receptor protein
MTRNSIFARIKSITLAMPWLLAVQSGWAQTSAVVSEKDFFEEMPIVLSVSRLPQRLDETPGAVTIIDRDMIRRSGARDVADLLRGVPGFQVSTSFQSVAPLASYHGAFSMFSNRIQLLIDGRSAYSPFFIGSIGPGLQTVALEDIERIEVLRGSNSAAYGARAILGVINIVTRHSTDTVGTQVAVSVGENGIRDEQARVGWGAGAGTYRLNVDRRADDGLNGANDKNQVNRVNFRSDLRLNAHDELQLRLGQLSITAGKGEAGHIDGPLRDSFFDASYAQMDWRRSLNPDEDLMLTLSHAQERYQDSFPYALQNISPLFGINDIYTVANTGEASSDTLTLQHTFRKGPATRVVWGGEFRSERVSSEAMYATASPFITDFTRLFGNLEWRVLPALVLNAGAMYEKSSVTGETLAPRVMLNWHVSDGHTLRAGVSKAFRPPSTFEQFANVRYVWNGLLLGVNTLASGNVAPESVLARELGYLGEFPKWGLNLDVRVFHEQINGFIRPQNYPSPRDYANDEDFPIRGLEYQLKWRPWRGGQIAFNQAYTKIDSKILDSSSVFAAPRLASSLSFFQSLPGNVGLTLTHQDNGTAILAGSNFGSRVAMTRTDLRLSKSLNWGGRRGEMALVLQNMGLPYEDFAIGANFEPKAFVSLRLED